MPGSCEEKINYQVDANKDLFHKSFTKTFIF